MNHGSLTCTARISFAAHLVRRCVRHSPNSQNSLLGPFLLARPWVHPILPHSTINRSHRYLLRQLEREQVGVHPDNLEVARRPAQSITLTKFQPGLPRNEKPKRLMRGTPGPVVVKL